jgi:hypothetical protein
MGIGRVVVTSALLTPTMTKAFWVVIATFFFVFVGDENEFCLSI